MTRIVRSEKEIDEMRADLDETLAEGSTRYAGMSFEEGVDACLRWLTIEGEEHPLRNGE